MMKKILVAIAALVLVLVLIGVFYSVIQKDDPDPIITGSSNTIVLSLDNNTLKFEDEIIYILDGTIQEDILNNIISEDNSPQSYRITTSEGSNKSLDKIYEYDRLYVVAENGVNESYYIILFIDSLDWQVRK